MTNLPDHGGALDWAATKYGIARENWLDLSTGITPYRYRLPKLTDDDFYRLPDAAVDERLRSVAAGYYGVSSANAIAGVPGSQAAIQWLPRLFPTTRVAVLSPTYSEHVRSWRDAGHTIAECATLETVPDDARVVIVVNPNNPDGRRIDPKVLLRRADSHTVVIDEAFADVVPDVTLSRHAGRSNLIILRSVGKFFGLAGLRLGFVLASDTMARAVRQAVGPWAISGPAAAMGIVALGDKGWAPFARHRLVEASKRLDIALENAGLDIVGGTPLFRLVSDTDASRLFDHLAQNGVLVRAFADHPHWLRFGIPGFDQDLDRVIATLDEWCRHRAV